MGKKKRDTSSMVFPLQVDYKKYVQHVNDILVYIYIKTALRWGYSIGTQKELKKK